MPIMPHPRRNSTAAAVAIAAALSVAPPLTADQARAAANPGNDTMRTQSEPARRQGTVPPPANSRLQDAPPRPFGPFNATQMRNAAAIVAEGKARGLPRRAWVIAVATAMQESWLRNLANSTVPASLRIPHEGVASDHDSVGLFQQRPNPPHGAGSWGTVEELMNPRVSAGKFYAALVRVRGWQGMPLTRAAQAVQISAYPNHYAKHEKQAEKIVSAIVG